MTEGIDKTRRLAARARAIEAQRRADHEDELADLAAACANAYEQALAALESARDAYLVYMRRDAEIRAERRRRQAA